MASVVMEESLIPWNGVQNCQSMGYVNQTNQTNLLLSMTLYIRKLMWFSINYFLSTLYLLYRLYWKCGNQCLLDSPQFLNLFAGDFYFLHTREVDGWQGMPQPFYWKFVMSIYDFVMSMHCSRKSKYRKWCHQYLLAELADFVVF